MRILLAFLAFVFAAAASAAPDPLLEKLLAGARATAPGRAARGIAPVGGAARGSSGVHMVKRSE